MSPNPAQDLVQVRLDALLGHSVELRLTSQSGQVLWQQIIPEVQARNLDLHLKELGLSGGFYYMECLTEFGRLVEVVIVK